MGVASKTDVSPAAVQSAFCGTDIKVSDVVNVPAKVLEQMVIRLSASHRFMFIINSPWRRPLIETKPSPFEFAVIPLGACNNRAQSALQLERFA